MYSYRFPIVIFLIVALSLPAAAGTVQVFLQGGQSNGDGRASLSGLPTYLQQPQTDVDFFFRVEGSHPWENQLIDLKPGSPEFSQTNYFGPEITFGRDMADYYASDPDTSVAIIKYANGGTRLYDQWAAPSGPEYVNFQNTVDAGMAAMQAAYPGDTVQIAGMIWMQGESDAANDTYANSYQSNLEQFIGDVRTRYGADLPFVIGRLSANQGLSYAAGHQAVMDAQTAVADANSRTGLVNTDSFALKSDTIHFNYTGMQDLGSAFASVMQTTMNNDPDPPDPNEPTITGALAHYTFDSDYNDYSGNGYHGAAYDGSGNGNTDGVSITNTEGEYMFGGGAASFTAERDWVSIPSHTFWSGNPYSFSFWGRDLADSTTGGMALGRQEGDDFFIWTWNTYVRWRGDTRDDNRQADFDFTRDNEWHHYTIVAGDHDEDGTVDDVTFYLDGEFVGTDPDNLTGFIVDAIGSAYADNLDFDWEGQIDEVWIFDRALTTDEINLLYTNNAQSVDRLPGDANEDGSVDVSDLGILATNYGTMGGAGWAQADFTGDGNVDVSDLGILATNYGTTAAAVPEPNALLLLAIGLGSLVVFRHKS